MKFAMSYSCGKDSTLSLHRMLEAGHTPVALIVMVNEAVNRSFFHGADLPMLECYGESLQIPLILCPSNGDDYHLAFERGLAEARDRGAVAVCFGDIDIPENRRWEEERCSHTGLRPYFPLWQRGRAENVRDVIRLGYKCLIKSVNATLLPKSLLGQYIDESSISVMQQAGIDICGENGEYHTLTVGGPIFHTPLPFETGDVLTQGNRAVIDIRMRGN